MRRVFDHQEVAHIFPTISGHLTEQQSLSHAYACLKRFRQDNAQADARAGRGASSLSQGTSVDASQNDNDRHRTGAPHEYSLHHITTGVQRSVSSYFAIKSHAMFVCDLLSLNKPVLGSIVKGLTGGIDRAPNWTFILTQSQLVR